MTSTAESANLALKEQAGKYLAPAQKEWLALKVAILETMTAQLRYANEVRAVRCERFCISP